MSETATVIDDVIEAVNCLRIKRFDVGGLKKERLIPFLTTHQGSAKSLKNLAEDMNGTIPFLEKGEPLAFKTLITPVEERFHTVQKWEGYVIDLKPGGFLARLVDKTHPGLEEEAEIPFTELSSEEDCKLVVEGAVFDWHIGYHTNSAGTKTRSSFMMFRNLPVWRREEIESARKEADQIRDALNWR